MKEGIVYLKVAQNVQVMNKKITLGDVADIYAWDHDIVKELDQVIVFRIKGDKNEKHVVSALKLIQLIQKQFPGVQVELIGEPDMVVEYQIPGSEKHWLIYGKLVVLSSLVFVGSAFTIMTFNTDVSVGDLFDQMYYLFTGEHKSGGSALELFYSIGIPIGILAFYNHYRAKKVKEDPTPIHIEMRNYEKDMNNAIIADASREGKEID